MPSKPDGMVVLAFEEVDRREKALNAITIKHPRLVDAESLIRNLIRWTDNLIKANDRIREEVKRRNIVEPGYEYLGYLSVIGPTGATKSTTLRTAMTSINSDAPEGQSPVAYISISESIRTTKALYSEFFRILKDYNNKDNLEATTKVPNARDIEEALIEAARARGTRVIILDELHNLLTHDGGSIGPAMAKALKSILNQSVVSLVFAGTNDVKRLIALDAELGGRVYDRIDLGKLDIRRDSDRKYFFTFIQKYEARLVKERVLDHRYGLTEDNRTRAKIYQAADGVIGVAVRILKIAVRRALNRGRAFLTEEDLADAVWAYYQGVDGADERNPFIDGPDEKVLRWIKTSKDLMHPA
jgi:hypothetical protein